MKKKSIYLTESDLHNMIKEAVNHVLNEIGDTEEGQYMLGRLHAQKANQGKKKEGDEVYDYAQKQLDKSFKNYKDDYKKHKKYYDGYNSKLENPEIK